MVFGDSDGLPGLTVDKFGDYLCLQIVSLGMETWKGVLTEPWPTCFLPKESMNGTTCPSVKKEGLPQITGRLYGAVPGLVPFREHDAQMLADLRRGQKTGHFLDQQENRGRIRPYCSGASVLDLCRHTGGFSIHAALYGAASVEAVDVSRDALEMLTRNAACNGVANSITTTCANVFDLVKDYSEAGKQYDLVICDPPPLPKAKAPFRALTGDIKSSTCGASGWSAPADTWPPGLAVSL